MIQRYRYGAPFSTEATVEELPFSEGSLPFLEADGQGGFTYPLADEDIVYGLGEQVRGINKRGWHYTGWNSDNPHHQEDTRSLYGAHNFLLIHGKERFGVFFDFPGQIEFDIGYTRRTQMCIRAARNDLDVYVITGENEKDIVRQFRRLIGKSYIPPFWAFGYGQSRWGYREEAEIRAVVERYREADIPLDSVYMDIDYMERYKDFTVDHGRFPDLGALSAELREKGIHLVPIIDAGVKIEADYDVYEEGKKNNYFCKDAEGEDFVGAVWPGRVHFPDFLNPKVREWFGEKYSALTRLGIDGFWNDMNEPAIFYTEDRLQAVLSKIKELSQTNMGIDEYFAFTGMVAGLNGNVGDYGKFYHNVNQTMVKHSEVHNLYGMNMTRAAYEALTKLQPGQRTLFFSRSSYIGAHRYGGIWQGDNKSWWSHILQSMQQLPALNMAGFLFVGADVGGFGSDTTEDLMMRWLQYSLFTPLFRNHSSAGTREQELYQFENAAALGEMIRIRYSLIPYLYSEYLKAVYEDTMMFRPIGFDFPDDREALLVEDQLFLGEELMLAPIYRQNAEGRYVYLPEEMMLVRMRKYNDYDTEILPKGHHYVAAKLEELIFFLRKGKAIILTEPAASTGLLSGQKETMLGYPEATYALFQE